MVRKVLTYIDVQSWDGDGVGIVEGSFEEFNDWLPNNGIILGWWLSHLWSNKAIDAGGDHLTADLSFIGKKVLKILKVSLP